ncbi:MAG TPA: hypothetical protein HA306_01045 [Methanosarcina sp.]|nr:hypothetical protein [Methanosarcina sp.]
MPLNIPVLAVRQEWAHLIATSYKIDEHRLYPAPIKYIGKDIAIYASLTAPKKEETQAIKDFFKVNYSKGRAERWDFEPTPRGYIVAVATLKNSRRVSREEFNSSYLTHANPLSWYVPGKSHLWRLCNIRPLYRLDNLIKFKFSGSMVWSSIPAETLRAQGVGL